MDNLLYYPYINVPRTDWTIRTLLYYNKVGSIVPQKYFYEPDRYDGFMRELILNDLVVTINPMDVLDRPWEISRPFINYINSDEFMIRQRRNNFQRGRTGIIHENKFEFNGPRIHADKFDGEIFYQLEQAGLAKRKGFTR